jgi:P4 family phage/plasmid primase-like protien
MYKKLIIIFLKEKRKKKKKKNEIEKCHYIITRMNGMSLQSQYQDLSIFLAKHSAKNEKGQTATHTRIPDKELNIFGGSYIIPKEDLHTFYSLYHQHVFINKKREYLTEKQLDHTGPIAVDFDFRYNYDVETRQHTNEHIIDMVNLYLEQIKKYFVVKPDVQFDIFIFEKPNVNRLADKSITKDGIHMIIGIQADHTIQTMIRNKILQQLPEVWDLPLENTWESVLDEGISKGTTNWQLFGSRKPGNEAYEMSKHFVLSFDPTDGEFMLDERRVSDFDLKNNFAKLSVQNDQIPKFDFNPKIMDEYNKLVENKNRKLKKPVIKTKMNLLIEDSDDGDSDNENDDPITINDIKNQDALDKAVAAMLKIFDKANNFEAKEAHLFAQILPAKYYEPGSHLLNRQVAFALKHTDDKLFFSWVKLRSKASDFDYGVIPDLFNQWRKYFHTYKEGGITKRSLMYWAKKENFEDYEKIKNETKDYYMDAAIETATEYDIAIVLKQLYKDKYVCVSKEGRGSWYQFKNHRWMKDKGISLRDKISTELYNLFSIKRDQIQNQAMEFQGDDDRGDFLRKKITSIANICIKLKKTTDKNKIMQEAADVLYDGEFVQNMDTNKHLLCFNNGVVDFKNKVFRDGCPEDYITITTRINYVPYDPTNPEVQETTEKINDVMKKLFPIEDLNRYMWDHLAACLIGSNKNQTFNVYHGSGSNGKSILADLMSVTLGEYKGTVPITLVTEKRGLIGGTSDEVLKLKGKRYAVMQEPSKGVKLNEGIMKELTGGDPIQARGLYSESEIFEPQFSLVVCTNNLFDIESNDDGTWRRIKKVDFVSKFIDPEEQHTDNTDYVYHKDKDLKDKLPTLAPVFASMLVKRAFETNGIVKDCETVNKASMKYRNGQDHIAAYLADHIEKTENKGDIIGKTPLLKNFKFWFEREQGNKRIPKGEELYAVMDKKFGLCGQKGWSYVKFKELEEESSSS